MLCCNRGQIKLQLLPQLSKPDDIGDDNISIEDKAKDRLYHYFIDNDRKSRYFRTHIRTFNSALSMVSLQAHDKSVHKGGPSAFKVNGELIR